jgi:histone acetyltransferase
MMQCKIHKGIDYENISSIIKQQRNFIINQIHRVINQKIYPPLDFQANGGKDFDFQDIAGLLEAGWTKRTYETAKGTEEKSFEEQCNDILKTLYDHENAWPFRQAVSAR